jgi:hypothetical protein
VFGGLTGNFGSPLLATAAHHLPPPRQVTPAGRGASSATSEEWTCTDQTALRFEVSALRELEHHAVAVARWLNGQRATDKKYPVKVS